MNKRAIIDLTALLDVILILLFAFILNINVGQHQIEQTLADTQHTNEELVIELAKKNGQIDAMQQEKQDLQQLTKGLAAFLEMNEEEISFILEEISKMNPDASTNLLEPWMDEKQIVQQLLYYQTLQSFFFHLDIGLKGNQNQLFIDHQSTGITISLEDVQQPDNYSKKKRQIMTAIEKEFQNPLGEANRILLSLSLLDTEVYQYAYELALDAIFDLEAKYGPDRIFKAEYHYIP
ncbi:MAG: hypothetical protein GX962_10100 [Epulopiscium sp.]|nr:hypothetical protein [Candidatus Epulonipiscium sp.]